MGNGVVYITNHDRKYSSMKRVCDELKAEGQISAQCRTLFIEDGAEWDASLAAAMQGSNLVIVHLMKNAMNVDFGPVIQIFRNRLFMECLIRL